MADVDITKETDGYRNKISSVRLTIFVIAASNANNYFTADVIYRQFHDS